MDQNVGVAPPHCLAISFLFNMRVKGSIYALLALASTASGLATNSTAPKAPLLADGIGKQPWLWTYTQQLD